MLNFSTHHSSSTFLNAFSNVGHRILLTGIPSQRNGKGKRNPTLLRDFVWRHHAIVSIMLSCLFLLCLEITGEPRAHNMSDFRQLASTQTSLYLQASGRGDSEGGEDSDHSNTQLHHRQPYPTGSTETNKHSAHSNNNNHQSDSANPASVIASSFRNVEGQTPDPKEEVDGVEYATRSPKKKTSKLCETDVLQRCLEALPPMNDTGIPSTPQAVNTACRIYDAGMSCLDSWSKNCVRERLRQAIKESIMGAHEMYSFLCKDPKFRADYLKHKDCYKKLSPHWDDCSRQFIEGLKRNKRHNFTAFCCIRLEFLSCVSKHSSFLCSQEATNFSLKMAETLARSSGRTRNPEHCINIHPKNCIPIHVNAALSPAHSSVWFHIIYITFSCFLLIIAHPFYLSV